MNRLMTNRDSRSLKILLIDLTHEQKKKKKRQKRNRVFEIGNKT